MNGRRYVDGGMRSPNNADLAVGASHIIVIAPDRAAAHAVNANMLDPRHRAQAARAGRQQARRVLDKVRAAWPC